MGVFFIVCDVCLKAHHSDDVWRAYFYNGVTRSTKKLMQCHLCYHCDKRFKTDGVTIRFTEKEADEFKKAGAINYLFDKEGDENKDTMWWIMQPLYCRYARRMIDPTTEETKPFLMNFFK